MDLLSMGLLYSLDLDPFAVLTYLLGALLPDFDWLVEKAWPSGAKSLISRRPPESGLRRGFYKALFHNLWALIAFSAIVLALCPSLPALTISFLMGYLGHLFVDSLARFGIFWLWPIGYAVGRERFYSNGPIFTGDGMESVLHAAVLGIVCFATVLKLCVA